MQLILICYCCCVQFFVCYLHHKFIKKIVNTDYCFFVCCSLLTKRLHAQKKLLNFNSISIYLSNYLFIYFSIYECKKVLTI